MSEAVERCATIARELDEPLAGTAARATGFVCVEHPGPWSPKAPTAAELSDLVDHLDVPDVRVQLVRRVHRDRTDVGHGVTVLLGHAAVAPADRWLRTLRYPDPATARTALLAMDPAVTTGPTPPTFGEPVDHDVWLVCTHARRDACCALHGRSVAIALDLAGVDVWETTHTGGHRFAATAIVLPDGLSLGRLDDAPDVATFAADLAAGTLPTQHLRGRCAVPHPAQAAEAALREHLALTARDAVLPRSVDDTERDTVVTLTVDDRPWTALVRETRPAPRPVSDGAEPTRPAKWLTRTLEEVRSPRG